MKQSPKLPAEKRRAQLVRAAGKVFARKGYNGATTEDIAREAGVTKGALYFHFKCKEDIFFEVVKDSAQKHLDIMMRHLHRGGAPEKVLESIIRSSVGIIQAKGFFTIEFWQQAFNIPRVRKYMAQVHGEAMKSLSRFIEVEGQLKRREADAMVWLLHALGDGMLVQKCCYGGQMDIKQLTNQVIDMCKLYLREKNHKRTKYA